jgi:hypothetical protein
MTVVSRPNLADPFRYNMELDEDVLLLVMEAMSDKYAVVDMAISQHNTCNKVKQDGCDVYQNTYGVPGACDVELSTLLSQQLAIVEFLRKARFVRENREIKSEDSFRDLANKARNITHTALRTLEPTGAYQLVTATAKVPEGQQAQPSDEFTGRYELTDEQLTTAERVRDGLKKEGVISEKAD